MYLARDEGLDPERVAQAEREVAAWREAGELSFPWTPERLTQEISGSLDWPPGGSPEALRGERENDS